MTTQVTGSGVNFNGSTSGTILLTQPAVAGSNTITLPAETGTVISSVSTGTVVTRAFVENTAYSSSAATIPADDTIPQVGEGAQILTQSITLKSASNRVRVTFSGQLTNGTGPDSGNVALFLDGAANAIHALPYTTTAVNYQFPVSFVFEHAPALTGSHTYSVRAGCSTYTTYINGSTGARLSGGVARWTMIIEELAP